MWKSSALPVLWMSSKTISDILNETGMYVSTTVGTSMEPLLRNRRDAVIIKKPDGVLKKYDLPLYVRSDGQHVLHRIIKVLDDCYIIRGDNLFYCEKIPHERVIGVACEFVRNGVRFDYKNRKYRAYVRIWCALNSIRSPFMRMFYKLRSFLAKLLKSH